MCFISGKYQYAELSKLFSVVSQLVRCCDVSSKCASSVVSISMQNSVNCTVTAVYNPQEYTNAPPLLTPKSWKNWISEVLTAPQIQHSKGLCGSTQNKWPTLQILFFTHDVITSSYYAYLSLQIHHLSAISAVIGNLFTIVKLQFKRHALCTCQKTYLQAREATQKIQFQRKKAVLFQIKCKC